MRVGVITTSYPRYAGEPAGGFVSELNDCLQRQGHEVSVLAAGNRHVDDRWQHADVTRIPSSLFYDGGAPDALGSARSIVVAGLFSARLLAAVKRRSRRWDALVAHWLTPSALACSLAAPRLPLWAIAHGSDVHLLAKSGLTEVVARLLDRPSVRLRFVSADLRQRFASAGPIARRVAEEAAVFSMGIELERFRSLRRAPNSQPVVAFLGRLVRLKGVDVLLRAIASLEQGCRLLVAGAGPEAQALRKLAQNLGVEVSWLGEVRGLQRDELLAEASIIVIPSLEIAGRREGMPVVAIEALAAGAQLIVSETGGLREVPKELCHSVKANDPQALCSCLQQVLKGRRAEDPDTWLEQFAWEIKAPQLLPGLIQPHSGRRSA